MSFDAAKLYSLLPPLYRARDQARAVVTPGWLDLERRTRLATLAAAEEQGVLSPDEKDELSTLRKEATVGPLASLIAVLAEQIAVLEEDLEQLYDDQFIETCAEWVVPYIGDLVGYRGLHGAAPRVSSPRAEVAHTVAFRRRKGTLAVLERLAGDVTDWRARAVEFFQLLVTTQSMNHRRLFNLATPDMRGWEALERSGTAFDSIARTVDVRRIASGRGRYNIPNVGLFLFRVSAFSLTRSPAVSLDGRRFRFHPLGIDQPLYTRPPPDDDLTELATPRDVPLPISRRVLHDRLEDYYGDDDAPRSFRIYRGIDAPTVAVAASDICVCNLGDQAGAWANVSDTQCAVDPERGRLALPSGLPAGTRVWVDFHYGSAGEIGGGEYKRELLQEKSSKLLSVPSAYPTIAEALTAAGGDGVIEIEDSGRYEETLTIAAAPKGTVVLRAAQKQRPTLVLGDDLLLSGGPGSEIRLDGLLVAGRGLYALDVNNELARLAIRHCTLVPGLSLEADGAPASANQPSLSVETAGTAVTIERSIVGPLRTNAMSATKAIDSIVDATASTAVAYCSPAGESAGGPLELDSCTVIGKVSALAFPSISNSIVLAALGSSDAWKAPVVAARRQEGCVRFSSLPDSARVPPRYRCLPESAGTAADALPVFVSLRYGQPAYGELATGSGADLLTAADDEGQPGAFHFLKQPQRESNLRVRLAEYLRAGLEAGIFYES